MVQVDASDAHGANKLVLDDQLRDEDAEEVDEKNEKTKKVPWSILGFFGAPKAGNMPINSPSSLSSSSIPQTNMAME